MMIIFYGEEWKTKCLYGEKTEKDFKIEVDCHVNDFYKLFLLFFEIIINLNNFLLPFPPSGASCIPLLDFLHAFCH